MIMAFVVSGFEHCCQYGHIFNCVSVVWQHSGVTRKSMICVTLGNIVGGALPCGTVKADECGEVMEQMKIISTGPNRFPGKFGARRQSGLVRGELTGRIEFAPEYRNKRHSAGWMNIPISGFCGSFGSIRDDWSPTVKPPRPRAAAHGVLQHARRFAQTPSDFPVSSGQVCLDGKRHRT